MPRYLAGAVTQRGWGHGTLNGTENFSPSTVALATAASRLIFLIAATWSGFPQISQKIVSAWQDFHLWVVGTARAERVRALPVNKPGCVSLACFYPAHPVYPCQFQNRDTQDVQDGIEAHGALRERRRAGPRVARSNPQRAGCRWLISRLNEIAENHFAGCGAGNDLSSDWTQGKRDYRSRHDEECQTLATLHVPHA